MKKSFTTTITLVLLLSFCFSASAAAPVQNRFASTYEAAKYNNSFMQYRMNCYGYATQFYYMGSASSSSPYRQMPGEFGHNHGTFASLTQSYEYSMTYWNNLHNFVRDRVVEDYAELGWSITESPNSDQAPAGSRKIALVVRQDGYNSDFHFYLQHSDGTWSHKPGSTAVSNISIDTSVALTNANIGAKSSEGGYDDGLRYFIIGKDAVTDYPHSDGHAAAATYSPINFTDKAGDSINQTTTISGNTTSRFDYTGDKDYFKFTPTTTRYYTISTSAGVGYDVDGIVYDSNGSGIASDSSTSNANFSVYLTSGVTYYIGMWDYQNHIDSYTLYAY